MSYQTVRLQSAYGIQTIQLYRPEAENALNGELFRELMSILAAIEEDERINVVVLEGLPHVFCSGMDFQEFAKSDDAKRDSVKKDSVKKDGDESLHITDTFTLFRQLAESSKIMVARVRGKVNAGGIGLIAACDLVVAEEGASFALSELLFGLLPAMVLPFLIRRIGPQKAGLLALSTQAIGVAEAHKWGLVDVYGADTDQLLRPYLQRWRRVSPSAIRQLKTYMNRLQKIDRETQALAVETISEIIADPTIKQGIRRYVEEGIAPWER